MKINSTAVRRRQRTNRPCVEARRLAILRTMEFAVSISPERHAALPYGITIGVTPNGYQWSSLFVNRRELRLLLKALSLFRRTRRPTVLKFTSKQ